MHKKRGAHWRPFNLDQTADWPDLRCAAPAAAPEQKGIAATRPLPDCHLPPTGTTIRRQFFDSARQTGTRMSRRPRSDANMWRIIAALPNRSDGLISGITKPRIIRYSGFISRSTAFPVCPHHRLSYCLSRISHRAGQFRCGAGPPIVPISTLLIELGSAYWMFRGKTGADEGYHGWPDCCGSPPVGYWASGLSQFWAS